MILFATDHDVTHDDEEQAALIESLSDEFHPAVIQKGGVLAGTQLSQRAIVDLAIGAGWAAAHELAVVGMIAGGESWRYSRARNDNDNGSRDVGLMQINIPHDQVGTSVEEELYDPVVNMRAARRLYMTPLSSSTHRLWTPWVAFNTGIYLHDTYRAWGLLGLLNHLAFQTGDELAKAAPDYVSKLHTPLITIGQLRALYPGVVL